MSERKCITFNKVSKCQNAEKRWVNRANINQSMPYEDGDFARAWCLRQCDWCDAEFGEDNCYFAQDDND